MATAAFIAITGMFGGGRVSSQDVITTALFIPHQSSTTKQPMPILGVGWTLNYEAWFYAMFAIALLLPKKRRIPALAIVFAVLAAFRPLVRGDTGFLLRTTSPLWFEFAFGMVIGALIESGRLISQRTGIVLLTIGVAALVGIHQTRPGFARTAAFGIPGALIVAGCVSLEDVFKRGWAAALKTLGDASYSLYLVHVLLIDVIGRTLGSKFAPPAGVFAVCVFGATVAGLAVHRFVERPLLALFRKPASVPGATIAVGTSSLPPTSAG